MAVRLDIRPRLDLRSPKPERRSEGGLRLAWGVSIYWVAGLSLAYAMHAGWLPVRDWLQVAWRQGSDTAADTPPLLAPAEPPAAPQLVPPPSFGPEESDDGAEDRDSDEPAGDEPGNDEPSEPSDERSSEPGRDEHDSAAAPGADEAPREPPREASRSEARHDEGAPAERSAESRRARRAEREPRADRPTKKALPKKKRRSAEGEGKRVASSGGGQSCEAAVASYREELKLGAGTPADLTSGQLGAVLNSGSYFAHCGVPPTTAVRICAAVQDGRAVGVTVSTDPPSGAMNRCVAGAVRGLGFPSHPRMDVTTTTFAAER